MKNITVAFMLAVALSTLAVRTTYAYWWCWGWNPEYNEPFCDWVDEP